MPCPIQPPSSPFDRLPVELVIEVFERCLDSYPRLTAKDAPLLFCSVSSSWRRIALDTPTLWTRFEFDTSNRATSSPNEDKNGMAALRLWLERSKTSLISFRVSHDIKKCIPGTLSMQVLAELVVHSHRWENVAFGLLPNCGAPILERILPGNLLGLKSISLNMKGLWSSPFEIQASAIPWNQLTALNFSFDYEQLLTLDQCLDVLAQCRNLLRCTINADCVFRSQSRANIAKATLPRLQHFELSLQSGSRFEVPSATSSMVSFLQQLELPRLTLLGLHWLVNGSENIPRWSTETRSKLTSILASLAPTLRSLRLSYLPLSDQDLIGCIQQVQYLSNLDLRFSLADKEADPITGAFLRASTRSTENTSSKYLPLLESLHIQTHSAHCTSGEIIDLIESRLKAGSGEAKLRSFGFVSLFPIVTSQAREKKGAWAQEGLDITIEHVF
ncbi:hypothetical protein H0H92_013319 [Tricholoma furcatifolium]|nr:hypothetical protein H0H92_013319 [Tricholoma furcatifolium]